MLHRLLFASLGVLALLGAGIAAPASGRTVRLLHDTVVSHRLTVAYAPGQIETAYGFTPLYPRGIDGTGQTIALVEIDGFARRDVAAFDARYHLPDPTIQEFYAGGQHFPLQSGSETTFDIEWLHALAPGASIQVYYLNNAQPLAQGWDEMARLLNMAAGNGAEIVSISLGACGPGHGATATRQALADLFHRGVSVFASSGDGGDRPGSVRNCGRKRGVAFPGSDPFVVSVGGTSLYLHHDATISHEVAWKWSGGGVTGIFPRAPFERAPNMPGGTQRWAPDVAFLGDPSTGVKFVCTGRWRKAGGTSLGAPAWAAAWALVRQVAAKTGETVGAAPRLLYRIGNSGQYAADFHDIVSGSNGTYRAGTGWDPVTGWGTPKVAPLAATVQAWSAGP